MPTSATEILTCAADDETDMVALEAAVRGIEKDGLVWGASKLVPVGFGIKKLQINLVIEDDKVGLDDLQEQIADFEDYVQSSDIVSSVLGLLATANMSNPSVHRPPCKSCRCSDDSLLSNRSMHAFVDKAICLLAFWQRASLKRYGECATAS